MLDMVDTQVDVLVHPNDRRMIFGDGGNYPELATTLILKGVRFGKKTGNLQM
jgi:hypothetical protein